jgi:molecular chaperone DnaK (HSP70)
VSSASPKLVVGIDLGTTHTVVAYAEGGGDPRIFSIPQLVTSTEIGARPLLASSLYAPAPGETVADPWDEAPFVVGEFARARGTAVPGRLVASAKSWLSHLGVDRDAPILPWGSDDQPELARVSPIEASAIYLRHVRKTWDEAHPARPLAEQQVVLTVPASFDESARELTLEAARRAGLAVKVLEEPQAAFYDFLQRSEPSLVAALVHKAKGDCLALICDVGGGTTDLSLMLLRARPEAAVSRIAVGHHLLLGGDNMDLALAYLCEPRISERRLDPGRFSQLVSACRAAKEHLLGEDAPDEYPVTVLSGGSQLVGAARSTRLARGEVEELLLRGFFPEVPADANIERKRSALVGFGLPYERDVAVTRHVASFLRRHAEARQGPHALLLNGGVFRAPAMADRMRNVIGSWGGPPLEMLENDDPDLAVARGAVAYGQSLRGHGMRIESSSARGYYVGLDAPREGEPRRLVSVVPRGAREAEIHRVTGRTFGLVVGRPARFDLFASDDAPVHPPGEVVTLDEDFVALPPVAVHFEAGDGQVSGRTSPADNRSREMLVELEGELTPVGTLDLACVELGSAERKRYRLAFELRRAPDVVTPSVPAAARRSAPPGSRRWTEAAGAIDLVFGKGRTDVAPRVVKDLVRELERVLGERATWDTELSRAIFDEIIQGRGARRRSPDHERAFWMLAGYTLRPGFGHPRDESRVEALAPLFPEMLAHQGEARGWQQFWIAWRRTAGGLDERWQTSIRDEVDPFLAPTEKRLKKRKGIRPLTLDAMLDMASALERVAPSRRAELGSWVLERTWTDRDHRLFSAIGRLGARVPIYASVHHVVPHAIVERWLDHLLREKWDELPAAAEAAVSLARMTGDRARDVGAPIRAEVEKKLVRLGAMEEWLRAVREVVAVEEADRAQFFGESLPVGLRLVDDAHS